MKLKTIVLSGMLLASPFCGAAFAQGTGFYVGASVGVFDYSVDERPARTQSARVHEVEDMVTGWSGVVGWRLDDTWAVELGRYDAGDAVIRGIGAPTFPGTYSIRINRTAWTLGAAMTIPIAGPDGKWDVVLRGGFEMWNVEYTTRGAILPVAEDEATDVYAGAQIRWNINPRFALGVGLDHHWGGQGQSVSSYLGSAVLRF